MNNKNNMKHYLLILAAFSALGACAQTKKGITVNSKAKAANGIVKVQIFLQERMPGTLRVDDNGQPLTQGPFLDYKAIVETLSGKQPTFMKVWIDGVSYFATPIEVKAPYTVGVDKSSQQPVVVNAKAGNKLWQLDLQKDETKPKQMKSSNTNTFVEGEYKGKNFSMPINTPVIRLASPLYP